MTDQQPPQERPEFQPPGGQPAQSGGPLYPAPGQPPNQPFEPTNQPDQPPNQPFHPTNQQFPPPDFARPVQAWTAPPKPPKGGRGSIWLGIGITVAVLLAAWGVSTAVSYGSPLYSGLSTLAAVLPFALVIAGIVLAAIPRTTRTGAGILIGIGAGILILGGLCVVLIAGIGS